MTEQHPAELVPLEEPHTLDPYPDRSPSLGGVRQHTQLEPHVDWVVIEQVSSQAPLPFAANTLPSVCDRTGRHRFPWTALGLYLLGQVLLAAAIAFGSIGPKLGTVVCLLWMACGLTLIAAQAVAQYSSDPAGHED